MSEQQAAERVAGLDADLDKTGWQRWHMQEMGTDSPRPALSSTLCLINGVVQKGVARQAPTQTQPPGHQQNDQDSHAQGWQEGFEQGQQHGQQQGQAQGYLEGQKTGYEEGYKAGYDTGHEAGYESGRAEGLQAAEHQAQADLRERALRLDALIGSAEQQLAQLGEQLNVHLSQNLVELALGIAQQITQVTLQANPQALLETIRQVLQSQPDQAQGTHLRLYVHPDDEHLIAPFLQTLTPRPDWQIITDKSIDQGGCVLHTALGQVDATLPTRWQRIADSVRSVLPQALSLQCQPQQQQAQTA